MTRLDDRRLYERMAANVVASWAQYAGGAVGAHVVDLPGIAVAVFPVPPERDVYNNALLRRDLGAVETEQALLAAERLYAAAGVDRFAVWVHETESDALSALEARGHRFDSSTRAMACGLDELPPRPVLDLSPPDWEAYLGVLGVPDGLLRGVDTAAFHVRIAALDGEDVATAMAYDHGGDCGIYNVVTAAHARRRGLGSAVTALLLHDARERGCTTASLQATAMAERVYAAAGFRDLGLLLELTPP